MRAFCSGLTRAKIVASVDGGGELGVVEGVEVGAGERAARVEAEGAADRLGDEGVVAGDDLDGDAELGESCDRVGGGWLGLVEEHEEPGEGQVVLVVDGERGQLGSDAAGDGDHTVAGGELACRALVCASSGTSTQRSRIASGAPLVMRSRWPLRSASTDTRRRS